MHNRTNAQPHNYTDEQSGVRTDAHLHGCADEQVSNHTTAQPFIRTDAQPHERTPAQAERLTTRESYDVYEDQAQTIEELRFRWSKERKKHVTKGQVMRELLEEILPTKR